VSVFFNNLKRDDLRLEVRVSFFNNLKRGDLRLEVRVGFFIKLKLQYAVS
jgi:hypothetical protein